MGTRVTAVGRATGVTNVRTDLWNVGGTYVFPPAPTQMSVVSTSANDSAAGTGVRTIIILYLDDQYNQQLTQVTLNGTTPVLTTPTNILRINKVFSASVGSGGSAAGNITITNGGNTYARIDATYTASRQAIGTVPSNMFGYITSCVFSGCSTTVGEFIEFDLRVSALANTLLPGIFVTVATYGISNGALEQTFDPPQLIPATADVKITCARTTGSGMVTAAGSFSGFLTGTLIT